MGLVGMPDPARQISIRRDDAKLRHIEVGIGQVTTHVVQQVAQQFFRARVMGEARHERRDDLDEALDWQLELGTRRIQWRKGIGDQLPGMLAQRASWLAVCRQRCRRRKEPGVLRHQRCEAPTVSRS